MLGVVQGHKGFIFQTLDVGGVIGCGGLLICVVTVVWCDMRCW